MSRLALFYPHGHEAHNEPGHPERPERVEAIRDALKSAGSWDEFIHLDPTEWRIVFFMQYTPLLTSMSCNQHVSKVGIWMRIHIRPQNRGDWQ